MKTKTDINNRRQPARRRECEMPTPAQPVLRFSPYAWAKLLFFRDYGQTEIGGFAVTEPDDLLYVADVATVSQKVTSVSVSFDDGSVADFFDRQVDAGRRPEQFARLWLHTHPGESPQPSNVDEETFHRVFGGCDWAVMFVLGKTGRTYARMQFNVGPGGSVAVPVRADYARPFAASDHKAWEAEYKANIKQERLVTASGAGDFDDLHDPWDGGNLANEAAVCGVPEHWLQDLQAMEPEERSAVLEDLEMAARTLEESEVCDEYDEMEF